MNLSCRRRILKIRRKVITSKYRVPHFKELRSPMKLFAFYIGGETANSLIEVHDVRFAAAEKIEDAYEGIRASWWGTPESLHLDCWGELTSADGHNITLKTAPQTREDKLWFVNLGGYDPANFGELHRDVFVVAPTQSKAKVKALKGILDWKGHHKDNVFDVEGITSIDDILAKSGYYVHLEKTDTPVPFVFGYGFNPDIRKQA